MPVIKLLWAFEEVLEGKAATTRKEVVSIDLWLSHKVFNPGFGFGSQCNISILANTVP